MSRCSGDGDLRSPGFHGSGEACPDAAHHQVDLVDWGLDQNLLVIECKYLNEVPDPVYEIQVLAGHQMLPVVLLEVE